MLPKRLNSEQVSNRTKQRRKKKQHDQTVHCEDLGAVSHSEPPDPLGSSDSLSGSDADFADEGERDEDVRRPASNINEQDKSDSDQELLFTDESSSSHKGNENSNNESTSSNIQMSEDDSNRDEMDIADNLSSSSDLHTEPSEAGDIGEINEAIFVPALGLLGNNNVNNQPVDIIAELDEPVCDCSNTTQGEALLMVLTLGFRHNMSYTAMVDNIGLLNNVLQREVIPANVYHLLKYVEPERTDDLYHIVCPECGLYLQGLSDKNLDSEVTCAECDFVIEKARNASNYFMTLGMKNQLKNLLERDDIADALKYRFNRQRMNEEALEDVYDGALYKNLSLQGQPLSFEKNISYSFNSDGVAFGKTSYQQIWPIYIMINELPPKLRVQNMLLVGIWVGKSEPDMNVFMQPFVTEANELSTNGFSWNHPVNGETQSVAIPLCCVVDSQARWRLLNHKSPAGYFGCNFCEIQGEYVRGFGVRFGMQEDVPDLRTHDGMKTLMQEVTERQHLPEKHRVVKGCKGACPLMNLEYFDLALGFVPDFMHMAKGCAEQHMNCILTKLSEEEISRISENIKMIVTPSAVTRTPRELKDKEKFTASEWRNFLVLYGPVVMMDIVPRKYLVHFTILSCAMHILLQKSVTLEQIEYCRELIIVYCALYEKYFGLVNMTHNIHLLLHVTTAVENHGPIWTHTCYPFEGKNRYLSQLAKSPLKVCKVVARKYHIFNSTHELCKKFNASDDILQYCQSIFSQPLWVATRPDDLVLLGPGKQCAFSEAEKNALQVLEIQDDCGLRFEHMRISGVTFTSATYGWSVKKNNSGAYLNNGMKCKIQRILQLTGNGRVILIVERFTEANESLWSIENRVLRHIRRVVPTHEWVAVNPSDVLGQYLFMIPHGVMYGTCLPYGCVGD